MWSVLREFFELKVVEGLKIRNENCFHNFIKTVSSPCDDLIQYRTGGEYWSAFGNVEISWVIREDEQVPIAKSLLKIALNLNYFLVCFCALEHVTVSLFTAGDSDVFNDKVRNFVIPIRKPQKME